MIFNLFKCPVCLEPKEWREGLICPACQSLWPAVECPCQVCALPLKSESIHVCGQCQQHPPAFDRVLTSASYQSMATWCIKRLKYRQDFLAGRILVDQFLNYLATVEIESVDCLVPMPLHWWRQLRRGFNQSALLAHSIGTRLNLPVANNLARRTRATPPLEGLSRKQRRRVMNGVFTCKPVKGRHIAVVDDVMTTGASAQALAKQLKAKGARQVDIWVMARTPD